jgi:hypothetical protein
MGIIPGMGVTRNEFLDEYEYDGKYYKNYEDIPFATKKAYETVVPAVGNFAKKAWQNELDQPITGHVLKGAVWAATKTFQYIDKESMGGISGALGLLDKGMTKAADAVEYHTGLYSPTAKIGTELVVDYLATGGGGKALKTARVVANKADNFATTVAKNILPEQQLAYETVLTNDSLFRDVVNTAVNTPGFKPADMFAATVTRKSTSRLEGSKVLGGQNREARLHYDNLKLVRHSGNKQIASTSTHHMNQLIQQADAVINHPKGDSILKNLRAKKIPVGDDIENYTSILDWNPAHLRNERVRKAVELYPDIPSKTFNDAFGASDFLPPQLTINEAEQLRLLKSKTDITTEEFFDSLGRKGSYPSIDLFKPDGTKITWRAKTGKEWDNRFKVINKHYGSNIDSKQLYNIKIDPELATYAPDHGYLHKEILDNLPSHKRLKELQKSGEWKTLSEQDATKLLIQVSNDSFKMSHGISKWRYGQIAEYYEKMKLNSKVLGKLKNKKWNQLPTNIQQEYFKENASKLSSYGSRTIPSMNELLTSTKKLTQKEKNFFGIK